jgi:hypothetical protein
MPVGLLQYRLVYKVHVLAFDDFQHLVDTRSNVPREAADFLKDLLIRSQDNKAHLSVVAAGLVAAMVVAAGAVVAAWLEENADYRRKSEAIWLVS